MRFDCCSRLARPTPGLSFPKYDPLTQALLLLQFDTNGRIQHEARPEGSRYSEMVGPSTCSMPLQASYATHMKRAWRLSSFAQLTCGGMCRNGANTIVI